MNIFLAAFLGILQGFTEFLPVSSSGHLVLAQSFFSEVNEPGVLFEAILHAGTLFAILFYFRKKLLNLDRAYIKYIIIGSIPAALLGLLFQDVFESLFLEIRIVGLALIITGVLNLFTDRFTGNKKLTMKKSFLVGIAQSFAIIPGISRSGATIFAATGQKIDRKSSAEFSFLLSVPAVMGANLLQFVSYGRNGDLNLVVYFIGFIFAFLSGVLAIKTVMKFLLDKNFKIFTYYLFLIGVIAIILG